MAISLGVFMGIFPVWGYQMLAAAFLAHFFKLNKVITLLASNISIPPMMPFILFSSYYIGNFIMGTENTIVFNKMPEWTDLRESLIQYLVGSVCLATVSAMGAGGVAFLCLNFFKKRVNG